MTGRPVAEGALYYASSRRRRVVPITDALRAQVPGFAGAVRAMLAAGTLPPPTTDVRRCRNCSLRDRCQPEAVSQLRHVDPAAALFDPDA